MSVIPDAASAAGPAGVVEAAPVAAAARPAATSTDAAAATVDDSNVDGKSCAAAKVQPEVSIGAGGAGGKLAKYASAVEARLDTAKYPHFLEDCASWTIPKSVAPGNWTIQGHSRAGERTGFHIPSMRIFLDAGVNSYKPISACLLTHGHNDHSHNIPCVAMGMGGTGRPPLYCPADVEVPVRVLARASQALNESRIMAPREEVDAIGVRPGEKFSLMCGRAGKAKVCARVVECVHTVPCIGYILSIESRKLKEELSGLAGREIAALRKSGTEVHTVVQQPVMAFLGDTSIEVFDKTRNPDLLDTPVIMVECTGMADIRPKHGHIHFNELEPVIRDNPQVLFVLMHFSRGLREKDIVQTVARSGLRNIVLFLGSGVVEMDKYLS